MAKKVVNKKNLTILGSETEFIGELSFRDNLLITGSFSGTINSNGDIEISKEAVCSVDSINANSVVVSGKVRGNIKVQDFVEMRSGSKIQGDIFASKIKIDDNVDFYGSVCMVENSKNTDLFSMNSNEYKDSLVLYNGVDND